MYVITVIPLSLIPRTEYLWCFHGESLPKGQIVSVPYGSHTVIAIVEESGTVSSMKHTLKNESFQLKKIKTVHPHIFPLLIIDLLTVFGNTYGIFKGHIILSLFPKWYISGLPNESIPKKNFAKIPVSHMTGTQSERITWIQNHSRDGKITICVPSKLHIKKLVDELSLGSKNEKEYMYTFHAGVSEAKQKKQVTEIQHKNRAILICTPAYIGFGLLYTDTLLFEDTLSEQYRNEHSPLYDVRLLFVKAYSLLPTYFLSTLSLHYDHTPINKKYLDSTYNFTLYTKIGNRHSTLFIHPKMEEEFLNALSKNKKIAFIAEKSDGGKLVCNDCKHTALCDLCTLELSIIRKDATYLFCSQCKKKYPLLDMCEVCQSWNISILGLPEKIVQTEIMKNYQSYPHISNVTSLHSNQLYSLAPNSFDIVFLISFDRLFLSNNPKSEMYAVGLIIELSQIAKNISIQTSMPGPNFLSLFKKNALVNWKNEYQHILKENNFPPFGSCFLITSKDKKITQTLYKKLSTILSKAGYRIIASSYGIYVYTRKDQESKLLSYLFKNIKTQYDISLVYPY